MPSPAKICSVDGCGRRHYGHGYCLNHMRRWHDHGDPLAGGAFRGEPVRYLREVILTYQGDECLPWPYGCNDAGYGYIRVDGRHSHVGRFICESKDGPPPTPYHQAAHSCGNGHLGCATPNHLRWASRSENAADALIHGTNTRGKAKLSPQQAAEIRSLRGRQTRREIAARFGVTPGLIGHIFQGRAHKENGNAIL